MMVKTHTIQDGCQVMSAKRSCRSKMLSTVSLPVGIFIQHRGLKYGVGKGLKAGCVVAISGRGLSIDNEIVNLPDCEPAMERRCRSGQVARLVM